MDQIADAFLPTAADEVAIGATSTFHPGKGDNRFSARAITLSHNRSAGSWLSLWYYYDRILDNDFFQVAVGQ